MKYTATLKIMGKKITATGASSLEAITNLQAPRAKGKSVLAVTNGERTQEKILAYSKTFALFSGSPMMRQIALKQMSLLFDL
jgi:hypothetical protein